MVIDKRIPRIHWIILIFLGVAKSYNVVRRDPYAIISETIVTRQRASCDGDILQLSCPSGTKISIQLVLYGRSAPSSELCEPTSNLPRIYTGFEAWMDDGWWLSSYLWRGRHLLLCPKDVYSKEAKNGSFPIMRNSQNYACLAINFVNTLKNWS